MNYNFEHWHALVPAIAFIGFALLRRDSVRSREKAMHVERLELTRNAYLTGLNAEYERTPAPAQNYDALSSAEYKPGQRFQGGKGVER